MATPVNIAILHQIGLQRYSKTVLRRMIKVLREMQADIEAKIRQGLPDAENMRDATSLRLEVLLEQVRLTQIEAHTVIADQFLDDIGDAADSEADFVTRLSSIQVEGEFLATVSAPQMRAAVMSQPLQGRVLKEWTADLATGDIKRVKAQITIGYLEGESIPQVVKRIKGVGGITERGAETLARTSMTHINARAVEENARANPDLFENYQWLSVLDNRTSPVCRARAGRTYRHGAGPLPPAHPNCRSTIYSLVRGVSAPDDLGFETWLKDQSVDDQRDVLGATRYELWKHGKLPIDRFVDGDRTLTIDQLRKRDAKLFERAGL